MQQQQQKQQQPQSAVETVYEFGSSPDEEEEDNNISSNKSDAGQSTSSSPHPTSANARPPPLQQSSAKKTTNTSAHNQPSPLTHHQTNTIEGANFKTNKNSSSSTTSISQRFNASFSSLSDNQPPSSSHSPINPINRSHQKPASNLIRHHLDQGNNDISSSDDQLLLNDNKKLITSNTSNTSLSSATTSSSRGGGNIGQSGHQSLPILTSKGTGGNQTLTGSSSASGSSQQQQQSQNPNFDSNVISERVKNLATQIYQELKRVISRCNYDEDILSGLMPLIVRVLESLDLAIIENQQLQVELELCKDDNEQLVIMFEKEKTAKRAIDKKLIESEYAYEEERQHYQQKLESLDNKVKMYELKTKNASDQATRFEEKDSERKKEYTKLHDRYTELLKSHCDVVERFRHIAGNNEAVAHLTNINVPPQQMLSSSYELNEVPVLMEKMKLKADEYAETEKAGQSMKSSTLKSWNADTELTLEDASLVVMDESLEHKAPDGSSQTETSTKTENTGASAASGEEGHENDSIAYTSMEKEFRKLIQENKDLLNTKNALNVVKDDLIAEVDRLSNEVSMYEQAVEQLNATKDQMKQKVFALDAELRKTKEELEKAKQKIRENNEEGVPYSKRKRFDRAEMAKVLMERNNFKERFMELQDAVRYTELVRANKVETEKRSGLWKFFSNLFGAPPREPLAIGPGSATLSRNSSPVVSYQGSSTLATSAAITVSDQQVLASNGGSNPLLTTATDPDSLLRSGAGSAGAIRSTNQRLSSNSDLIVLMDSDINVDRSHIIKSDGRLSSDLSSGYIHAYGWSLPASSVRTLASSPAAATLTSPNGIGSGVGGSSSLDNFAGGLQRGILSSQATSSSFTSPSEPVGGIGNQSALMDGGGVGGGVISMNNSAGNKLLGLQVPIPQYCRPLTGDSLGMKIWCATAIDLSGGYVTGSDQQQEERSFNNDHHHHQQQTKASSTTTSSSTLTITEEVDQRSRTELQQQNRSSASTHDDSTGSMVNISTSTPVKSIPKGGNQHALKMLEKEVDDALKVDAIGELPATLKQLPILKTTTDMVLSALPMVEDTEELSSCVWICSTQHSRSKITIIDIKTRPNELLDSFYVPTFLYCIKSIPGFKLSNIPGIPSSKQTAASSKQFESDTGTSGSGGVGGGAIDDDQQTPSMTQKASSFSSSSTTNAGSNSLLNMINELILNQKREFYRLVEVDLEADNKLRQSRLEAAKVAATKSNAAASSPLQSTSNNNNLNASGPLNAKDSLANQLQQQANSEAKRADQSAQQQQQQPGEEDAEITRILDNTVSVGIATLQKLHDFVAHTQPVASLSSPDESISLAIDVSSPSSLLYETTAATAAEVASQAEELLAGGKIKAQAGKSSEFAKTKHTTSATIDDQYQDVVYYQPISTSLSTVWMGGKDSILYIHSAIGQWKDCIACVKLPDSILQICHHRGKVFVALADGSLCVFFRNIESKQWEFSQYLLIDINMMADAVSDIGPIGVELQQQRPQQQQNTSLTNPLSSSSSSSTNRNAAGDTTTTSTATTNTTSPNNDQVQHQADTAGGQCNTETQAKLPPTTTTTTATASGNSSIMSISVGGSSSSTNAKRLPKSKVAGIRCLEIANRNLWIGYKNRVLIIDPITLKLKHTFNVVPQVDNQIRQLISMKDGVFVCLRSDLILRLYSSIKPYQHIQNIDIEPVVTRLISPKTFVISHITAMKVANNTLWIGNAHGIILTIPCKLVPQISEAPIVGPDGKIDETVSSLSIARFVPKCDITNAQISFHGHKDAVKFFINAHNLMLSGGQGYLDFRLDMDDQSKSISDKSHLILWQLPH